MPGRLGCRVVGYSDRVVVSWGAVAEATSYKVWRADAHAGEKTLLAETTGLSYEDLELGGGPFYFYWVQACNEYVCSRFFDPVIGGLELSINYLPLIAGPAGW